jgi:Na+/melibiose symporter-like transporter
LQLLLYGLPGLPIAALMLPLYVSLPTYYAQDLGVGFTAVGAMLFLARIWDVVSDPLIGTLSDRTTARMGRRKPWMLAGVPILLAGAWLTFDPPVQPDALHLLLFTMLLYLGGTMILLPYTAWATELSPHYHERSRIAAAREVAIVIGTLAAMGVPAAFGWDRATALQATAVALSVLVPLTVLGAVRTLPDEQTRHRSTQGWRGAISILWRNRPFRLLIAAYFLNGIAYGLPATLFLLYVEHVIARPEAAWPLLALYFVCAIAAVPLWLRLSRRIGKHRAWMAAMGLAAVSFWPAMLLGPGDVWWFALVCVLTGLPLGGELVLPPSMQADVIDLDTLFSGRRRAGLFFALWGVATKVPLALAVGIAFPILDLAGFASGTPTQDSSALVTLAALYSLLPVAIKLLAIWLARGYNLDETQHRQVLNQLGTF